MSEFVLDLWAGRVDIELSTPVDNLWILTFHEQRRHEIENSENFQALCARWPEQDIRVLTFEGIIEEISKHFHEPSFDLLSEEISRALLRAILEKNRQSFPFLERQRQQLEERQAGNIFSELWTFMKRARLFASSDEEAFSAGADDIFGEKERLKEIQKLCDVYEQEQELHRFADPVGARLMIARAFESIEEGEENFGTIIIDQPERLYPLEERMLVALSRAFEMLVVVDEHVGNFLMNADRSEEEFLEKPSLDYVRGVWRFLENSDCEIIPLEDRQKEGQNLVKALFDEGLNKKKLKAPFLELWSRHDHREEVHDTARRIRHYLDSQKHSPRDIVVTVPDLKTYSPLIKELFDAAENIPFQMTKVRPLTLYPSVIRLKSVFSWVETGTSSAMLCCYEGFPESNMPSIRGEDLFFFRRRYKHYDRLFAELEEEGEFLGLGDSGKHSIDISRLYGATRKAQMRGGHDFEDDWLSPLFISARYWLSSHFESPHWIGKIMLDLVALEKSWRELEYLREPDLDLEKAVSFLEEYLVPSPTSIPAAESQVVEAFQYELEQEFFEAQNIAEECPEMPDEAAEEEAWEESIDETFQHNLERDRVENQNAYEELVQLLKTLVEEEKFQRDRGWVKENQRIKGFSAIQGIIMEAIDRLQREAISDSNEAVMVTEYSEARILRPHRQVLFCLGLTTRAAEFLQDPIVPENDLLFEHPYAHEYEPSAALRWTLGRFLRTEEHLIFSRPRVEENKEARPAVVFLDLERWKNQGSLRPRKIVAKEDSYSSPRYKAFDKLSSLPKELSTRVKTSKKAIESRAIPLLTAYDGNLGKNNPEPSEHNEYSPTMLEMLADCPHRHFFSNMLFLGEFPEVRDELPRHEVGTAVHLCLELFWESNGWKGDPIDAENFDEACRIMQRIALEVLDQSGVDWNRGPLRRFDRKAILLGLDQPGDSGPRGMLKAALAYHRDLPFLSGPPFQREMEFGMGEDPSVPINNNVAVRGIIDRVDCHYDENDNVHFLILDYKTGRGKTIRDVEKGKALQIAIYALVAKQRFSNMEGAGIRGGVLILNDPNKRSGKGTEALDHPLHGVYREHITAKKSGRSWVCAEDTDPIVDRNLQAVNERIEGLDQKVRKGELWQNLTPDACGYCNYRDICFHDEAVLEEKLENHANGIRTKKALPRKKKTAIAVTKSVASAPKNQSTPKLSTEQELAADANNSVSVSAGAGSGKTFILKTRVSRLIRQGVSVRSILAITFTEKAAGEIRERIEQALGEALDEGLVDGKPLTKKERRLFVKARSEMASASISTIHAFCHQIISLDPILSSASRSSKLISGPELEELEREVMRDLFSHRSLVSEDIEALLSQGIPPRTLRREIKYRLSRQAGVRKLLRSMGRTRQEWSTTLPKLQNELLRQNIQPLRGILEKWHEEASEWAKSEDGIAYLEDKILRKDEFRAVLRTVNEALDEIVKNNYFNAGKKLLDALHRLETKNKTVGFRKGKKLPRNWWKEIRDELSGAKLVDPVENFDDEYIAIELSMKFLEVIRKAQEIYHDKKQSLNILDFEDLIEKAYQMISGEKLSSPLQKRRNALIKKLQGRFQHILVDEFQDTDQRQWDIVKAFIPQEAKKKRKKNKPTVFIVGDAKQSIYGWRNSDNRVFNRACDYVKEELHGHRAILSDNYRSGNQVIEWINKVFDSIFTSEYEFDGHSFGEKLVETAVPPQPMKAKGSLPQGSVKVFWIPKTKKSTENLFNKEETFDEFTSIARLTSKILQGDSRFSVPEHKGPKVGILCRTTRTLRGTGQALDKLSIPYSSSHRAGFFSQPAVVSMETALRALTFEKDDVSLAGLLRGPLLGWSDKDLLEAKADLRRTRKGRSWMGCLRRGEWSHSRGQEFYRFYKRWKAAAKFCSPSAILRLIIADTGIDVAYASSDKMSSLRNIWRLIEMVENIEGNLTNGIVDLLSWFSAQRLSAPEGAAMAPADDIPVVLTTIHGSKGLEFPIVILPGLGRRFSQDHDFTEIELPHEEDHCLGLKIRSEKENYKRTDTILSSLLKQRSHARTRSEEKRLFYVACTRASVHLVLPLVSMSRSLFGDNESVAKSRRALRFATNHRTLITACASPDDKMAPGSLEFGPEDDTLTVPVVSLD